MRAKRRTIPDPGLPLPTPGTPCPAPDPSAGLPACSKPVHAAMVVLYLLAEWVAAQVRHATEQAAPAAATVVADVAVSAPTVEAPAAIAYRTAASTQLRRTSALAGLN